MACLYIEGGGEAKNSELKLVTSKHGGELLQTIHIFIYCHIGSHQLAVEADYSQLVQQIR